MCDMKIRVGIMGLASIARRSLIPSFTKHAEFEVGRIASRNPELGCTYQELLEDDSIDMIYCPLPTGLHFEWVRKAIAAGKHVLCEKSLATTFNEVQTLVDEARVAGRFLMESFQFRFHRQNLYVKELLAEKAIGDLHHIVVRFGIPPFPEGDKNIRYSRALGGGALLDNGAYTLKCASYLLGSGNLHVVGAMCGGAVPELGSVDITGAIMLRSGDIAVHAAYGFDHYYQNGYEVWGSGGKISTARAFTAREDFDAPVVLEMKSGREIKTFRDDHFAGLLDYVSTSIANGDFETEYRECLEQARLLKEAYDCAFRR